MKYCEECIESDFMLWKYRYSNVIWEIIGKYFRPIIGITKTKKFNVLSIMENI